MGYFSNGTEGEGFFSIYCEQCVHYTEPDDPKQCPIWMLHLSHNGDQHTEGMLEFYPGFEIHGPTVKLFLDQLIVRTTRSQKCAMFVPRADERVNGGTSWCASLRHSQPMEDRNSGAPCLRCLAEEGVLHHAA